MNRSNPKNDFVHVNGIRLHYLDWGGNVPALIFLKGVGSSACIFNKFAPRFTDKFPVPALTRRGHGDSDYPEMSYGPTSLLLHRTGGSSLWGNAKISIHLMHRSRFSPPINKMMGGLIE